MRNWRRSRYRNQRLQVDAKPRNIDSWPYLLVSLSEARDKSGFVFHIGLGTTIASAVV